MQRPCEALNATSLLHPLASACCSCIVTATVTITTPNNASVATTAIMTNAVLLAISKISINNFFNDFSYKSPSVG
jgi:hypothetical protein